MAKKLLYILLPLTLILLGGYYYWNQLKLVKGDIWSKVPDNVVLVYECNDPIGRWNGLLDSNVWQSLAQDDSFESINDYLRELDSLGGKSGAVDKLLKNNSLLSLQLTSKNWFDFVFYIDLSTAEKQALAYDIIDKYKGSKKERLYQGYTLHEIGEKDKPFTYLIDENIFIGSFTPFLVEDVVRLLDGKIDAFKTNNPEFDEISKLADDDGNLYINVSELGKFFIAFGESGARDQRANVVKLGKNSFLDVSINDERLLLNGFTHVGESDYLNIFKNQVPQKSDLKYYVSNSTTALVELTITDAVTYLESTSQYYLAERKSYFSERNTFINEYGIRLKDLYSWIDGSLACATMEAYGDYKSDRLAYIECSDVNEGLNYLNELSESIVKTSTDTVYQENFGGYDIRELNIKEFPYLVFGPDFTGFEECYYMLLGKYIVMGTSMQVMKDLVDDIDKEETWGRSVTFNKFLNGNMEEANLAYTFNLNRGWNAFINKLDDKWQRYFQEKSMVYKNFDLGSIQFSALDESFYTSIALRHEPHEYYVKGQQFESLLTSNIENKIITKPFVVRNHITNGLETLVQDSVYNLHLISEEGKVLWTDSIGEPIVGEIEQVDYYKNGKVQYFFATNTRLHIIDRLGNKVENYPITLGVNKLQYANVVDYDKSKRYRFLLGDEYGSLYLFNKAGVNLEGWMPRKLTGKLASKPFHLRVRGKDCIVAMQSDGVMNVLNRRGEDMPGFPLQLDLRVNTEPHVHIGSDFKNTIFSVLGKDGKVVKLNLLGEVIRTEQLYKENKDSEFTIIPDALGKSYLIARQDMNRLVLLNSDNEEVLSKDYLSYGKLTVQYYNFSPENKIYAITDRDQGFTYIYDKEGTLVNSRPIDSAHEIAIIYFDTNKKYNIYCTSENQLKILSF